MEVHRVMYYKTKTDISPRKKNIQKKCARIFCSSCVACAPRLSRSSDDILDPLSTLFEAVFANNQTYQKTFIFCQTSSLTFAFLSGSTFILMSDVVRFWKETSVVIFSKLILNCTPTSSCDRIIFCSLDCICNN